MTEPKRTDVNNKVELKKKTKIFKGKKRFIPYARGFKPSSKKNQIDAIGSLRSHQEYNTDAIGQFEFFSAIPQPTSVDDWLAQYNEEGQTYVDYLHECPWLSRRKVKCMQQTFIPKGKTLHDRYPNGKIYILPIGDFDNDASPKIEDLITYAKTFLCLPIEALPGIKFEVKENKFYWTDYPCETPVQKSRRSTRIKRTEMKSRHHRQSGRSQICVDSILDKLKQLIPSDAICLIGLTMHDLYADEPDLFVAGMAAGYFRVAVFSFTRYDPIMTFSTEFWHEIQETEKIARDERKRLVLQRSCKLLVHELCHLLGLAHCVYFSCCMNGSGHLSEDFRQPMHLCPVDLRKLQTLCGFDVLTRYGDLLEFYKTFKFDEESMWVSKRIDYLKSITINVDKESNK